MTKSSIFFLQITIFLSCVLILLQIYRSENKLINVQQTYFLTTCAIKANYVYEHVCTTQTHLQQPAALLSWFITHECRYTIGMLADPLVKALSLSLSLCIFLATMKRRHPSRAGRAPAKVTGREGNTTRSGRRQTKQDL